MSSRVLIIDYGSQYTQLIARRVREARVYSEIHPPTRSLDWVREWRPTGIILSGGPNSVYGENVPTADPALLDVAPVLGVCYGMQLIAHLAGGAVERAGRREYGRADAFVEFVFPQISVFPHEVSFADRPNQPHHQVRVLVDGGDARSLNHAPDHLFRAQPRQREHRQRVFVLVGHLKRRRAVEPERFRGRDQ